MSLLSCGPGIGHFSEGEGKGFVVCKSHEGSALQEITTMTDSQVEGQELMIERAVFSLWGGGVG